MVTSLLCHFSGPGESPLLGLLLRQWRTLLWRSCLIRHNCFNQRRWASVSCRSSSCPLPWSPFLPPWTCIWDIEDLEGGVLLLPALLLYCCGENFHSLCHLSPPHHLISLYHFPQPLTHPGKKALQFGHMLPDYLFLHA